MATSRQLAEIYDLKFYEDGSSLLTHKKTGHCQAWSYPNEIKDRGGESFDAIIKTPKYSQMKFYNKAKDAYMKAKPNMSNGPGMLNFLKAVNQLKANDAKVASPCKPVYPQPIPASNMYQTTGGWVNVPVQAPENTPMYTLGNVACGSVTVVQSSYHEDDLYDLVETKKKDKTMFYGINTIETHQKQHLEHRLDMIEREKDTELRKKFGLINFTRPTTAEELVATIKAGEFSIKDLDDTEGYDFDYDTPRFLRGIVWADPKIKKDQAAYDAAIKPMAKAYTEARTEIVIKSLEDGLKAVHAFEAKTFH